MEYKNDIPSHVSSLEAAILYRYMTNRELTNAETETFCDPRMQVIYDRLKYLRNQIGCNANSESVLLSDLEEFGLLKQAGGQKIVHHVFNGYEDERILQAG